MFGLITRAGSLGPHPLRSSHSGWTSSVTCAQYFISLPRYIIAQNNCYNELFTKVLISTDTTLDHCQEYEYLNSTHFNTGCPVLLFLVTTSKLQDMEVLYCYFLSLPPQRSITGHGGPVLLFLVTTSSEVRNCLLRGHYFYFLSLPPQRSVTASSEATCLL